MQKNISRSLALAFLSAVASAASAQTTAQFYGNIDESITSSKVKGVSTVRVDSGTSSSSIFGIKDTEDLGGAMKAIMRLEGSFNADDGTQGTSNTIFNRDSYVGLTQGANTVKVGRLQTLTRTAFREYEVFGGNAWGIGGQAIDQNGKYAPNSVQYDYSAKGVTASIQHTQGEKPGGGITSGSTNAYQVGYANGPMSGMLTHTRSDAGQSNTLLGASYGFDGVKTSLLYQSSKHSTMDHSFVLGARASLSEAMSVLASVGQVKLAKNGDSSTLYSVGADYAFSKRTNVYTALAKSNVPGQDSRLVTAGIRHKF